MLVDADPSIRTASIVWQPRSGAWALTIICKMTFVLSPGESVLDREQDEINEHDNHWNDDETRSLHTATDLVPFKPRADVLVSGHAYAPRQQPVASLVARIIVGAMDKAIEVSCDRVWTQDGRLQESSRFLKMPLRYERAAGGPDTSNPVGVRSDIPPNRYGQIPLPNILPPGITLKRPGEPLQPVGLGPIAPTWPTRLNKLRQKAGSWSARGWRERPLPDLDPGYFNAAPPDQQVDVLRSNERIVLENLHPEHPRLVTSLPGQKPRAFLERRGAEREELALRCDTLSIDTDQGRCWLVWRGQALLQHPQDVLRAVVSMEGAVRPEAGNLSVVARSPLSGLPFVAGEAVETMAREGREAPVLPFQTFHGGAAGGPTPRAPSEPTGDASDTFVPQARKTSTLPFGMSSAGGAAPSWLSPSAPPPPAPPPLAPARPVFTTEPPGVAPPAAPGMAPFLGGAAAAPPPRPPVEPPAATVGQLAAQGPGHRPGLRSDEPSSAPGPVVLPAPLPPVPLPPTPLPSEPRAVVHAKEAALGGAVMASNAALVAPAPRPQAAEAAPARHVAEPGTALQLLWHDPDAVPRIRRKPEFRQVLREADEESFDPDLDDVGAEKDASAIEERREVFEVVARARAIDDVGLSDALAGGVRKDGKFVPPLALIEGEMVLPFDEIETLKAAVAATTPFAAADERLRAALADADAFLGKADGPVAPAVPEALTARIREAFAQGKRPSLDLDAQIERALISKRCYQRRELLGGTQIRALIVMSGSRDAVPTYLPDSLAKQLPMAPRFRARVIADLHFAVDQYESHPAALGVLALGWVLSTRRG